jgi:uncharacterized protein YabN with tetrapyrrole methylase and pyrophosphatase domain
VSAEPLAEALRLQREAAALGFDWRRQGELWDKLAEEIGELREAVGEGPARIEDELGDLLFMAVKFARRFAHVCDDLVGLPPIGDPRRLEAMEARWQDAKRAERNE